VARSQPAGGYRDASSVAHADAEAANANAYFCPTDRYADCVCDCLSHCNIHRYAFSHLHIDGYVVTHGHPYAYGDCDSEAADGDSLSDAYSASDHRADGQVGFGCRG
jgi:hypothetical protein